MIDLDGTTLCLFGAFWHNDDVIILVYSCFVFGFDAIFEIVTAICFFVANLRVGSPGASELHYFDGCSDNDGNCSLFIKGLSYTAIKLCSLLKSVKKKVYG